jgi:hypothetical protein
MLTRTSSSVHLGRLRDLHALEHRRRDVGEPPARAQLAPDQIVRDGDERIGFVVCAVCGWPVTGSIIVSQLP